MDAELRERVAKAMWESRKYRGTWEAGTTETERADYLHMAAAALSVAQGQGWRPIESAPRDGTVVIVCSPADGVNSSHYEGGMWQGLPWRGARHPDFERAKPTHWQPLPAAPAQPDGVSK